MVRVCQIYQNGPRLVCIVCESFHQTCVSPSTARESLARPQFVEKLKNITVKQGTLVELAVKAIGNPLPDIVWLKNSDIISPHKHPHIK